MDPKLQAWRYSVQQELDGLLSELAVVNERIAELVRQGLRSHALNVLTVQALSLAGQIDELRCLLVVPNLAGDPSHRTETPSTAFGGPAGRDV
jgi:hypothetical protein